MFLTISLILFYFVQVGTSIEEYMEKRKGKAEKSRTPLQPQILVLGSSILDPVSSYVIVSDTIVYCVDAVIEAIDICFKSFYVFELEYPSQALDPWMFIQHMIFNLASSDKESLRLRELKGYFKRT